MGFKEFIKSLGEKQRERKELLNNLSDDLRLQKLAQDRQKSSNERELERYIEEDREEMIKRNLEYYRKKRDNDIRFNHNPLNVKNITKDVDWEVLKEKNLFKNNENMFSKNESCLKGNNKLLKSNKRVIKGGKKLFKL